MFDQPTIGASVARWTALGVTLPKDLTTAIEVFESVRYAEVGHYPVFNVDGVTAKNAEARIREFASELVLSQASGGASVLDTAKHEALNAASRRVIGLARTAVIDIVDQLTPEFEDHADAYSTAVAALPEQLTADAVVSAGPDAAVAYQTAKSEAAWLNNIDGWVSGLNHLFSVGHEMDPVLRLLRPETAFDLIALDAVNDRQFDQTAFVLNPIFVHAARNAVPFAINTPAQAAEIRRDLETAVVGLNRPDGVAYIR